jgi:hypothetical protein
MACNSQDTDRSYSEAACQAQHSITAEFNYSLRNLFRCEALGARSAATKMNAAAHFEGAPPDDYSLEAERKTRKIICRRAINLR